MTWTIDQDAPGTPAGRPNFAAAGGPRLVGLCGAAGVGKSTVAHMFEALCGAQQMALADPIVNMLHSLLADAGVGGEWITERALKERPSSIGYSYRHLAQTLGTEWGRNTLDTGIWLRVAQARAAQALALGHHVVISDVRYPNEAGWVASLGGTVVRVMRPHVSGVRAHSSELHAHDLAAAHTISNDGSLQRLRHQVADLADTLGMHHPATSAAPGHRWKLG